MTSPERPVRPAETRSPERVADHERSVAKTLDGAIERALTIAAWQEAGQARTPITDCLRSLVKDDGQPINVALIGLTPEAVSAVLAWLIDHDHHICKVVIPEQVGVAELLLQDRGFVIEGPKGRQEFDDVAAFLHALHSSDLVHSTNPNNWMNPLRMHLAAPAKRQGMLLLVPNGLPALLRKPAHVSLLADRAALVLVAGAEGDAVPVGAAEALNPLLSGATWIPVVTDGDGTPAWLPSLSGESGLSPIRLSATSTTLDEALFSNESGLRRHLRLARRRRSVGEALELLQQDMEQAITTLANRRRMVDESAAGSATTDNRSALDGLRRQVIGDLASLRRDRDQVSKVAQRTEGDVWKSVQAMAQELTRDDLHQTANGADWMITLHPAAQARVQQTVEALALRLLSDDVDLLRDGLQASAEQAANELTRLTGVRQPLSVRAIDQQVLWENLMTSAKPEVNYKGTIPRMTFGTRLGNARKPMMALSMVAFMFGGIATLIGGSTASNTLRTVLYASMLPLFIIGFIWTYVAGSKQEELQLTKEADRLRDGLLEACKRAIAEFQREKQAALAQYLSEYEKELLREAEERFRAVDDNRRRQREQDVQKTRDRNRNLETREKETQRNTEELRRLTERELKEIDRSLGDWARDLRRAGR